MHKITYEVGVDEFLHPDWIISSRMEEFAVSDCQYGCKLYRDPQSSLIVLGHGESYGCKRSREEIMSGV